MPSLVVGRHGTAADGSVAVGGDEATVVEQMTICRRKSEHEVAPENIMASEHEQIKIRTYI